MSVTLCARYVFPVHRPPIENGVVTIDGQRIVAVGAKTAGQSAQDLGDVALMPGFVNAHTHLEFSHLRSPLGRPGMPLTEWIRLIIAERGRGADPCAAISDGLAECLASGTTAVGEIATAPWQCYDVAVRPRLALFAEVIGFSQARADSAFALVAQRLSEAPASCDQCVGISPHAPYTVSETLLTRLVAHARQLDLPVAMHLAESTAELEFLSTGRGPFRELLEERSMWDGSALAGSAKPEDYLHRLRSATRALVIHGNYLNPQEQDILAHSAKHMTLVYCPRTHLYFQHPPYPLENLLARGVRVALGTDSRASNPDLNFVSEIRACLEKHPTISPQTVLTLATLNGAIALGCESEIGRLEPGKTANLVAMQMPQRPALSPDAVIEEAFATADRPAAVWLNGVALPQRQFSPDSPGRRPPSALSALL